MLSSIHPFGERSRNNSFWLTALAHVFGSVAGGLALGAVLGTVGWISTTLWPVEAVSRPVLLGTGAAAATIIEATGRVRSLPTRLHQVDENWIHQYRGWVYGGGFGIELGFGVSTIITTALVHVMIAAMVLVGSMGSSLVIGAVFGAVRGAAVLSTRRVDSPEALRHFHRGLAAHASSSRKLGVVALGMTSLIGLSGAIL